MNNKQIKRTNHNFIKYLRISLLIIMVGLFLYTNRVQIRQEINVLIEQAKVELGLAEADPIQAPHADIGEGSAMLTLNNSTSIPYYSGEQYIIVNNNTPFFTEEDFSRVTDMVLADEYEFYSELDSLGRAGPVFAVLGKETMPAKGEARGSISSVKPSGWKQFIYTNARGKEAHLYERCHLIGWQLSAENANKKNLITGTVALNHEDGMLQFENMVADYLKEWDNRHVLYRVTPIYIGNELVARGVLIEAESIEDTGEAIKFNVFIYNNEPGITIDYLTGQAAITATEEDNK